MTKWKFDDNYGDEDFSVKYFKTREKAISYAMMSFGFSITKED